MSETGYKCRLRVIFAERRIKHGEFAEKIGVSKGTLSSIVNDKHLPMFDTTYEILQELKKEIQEVWEKIEDNKKNTP